MSQATAKRVTFPITPTSQPIRYFKLTPDRFTLSTRDLDPPLRASGTIKTVKCKLAIGDYLSIEQHLEPHGFTLNQSETTVLNFQVGTGKTRLLHELIRLYVDRGYVVFYCAPFKRLINQNETDISPITLTDGSLIKVHNFIGDTSFEKISSKESLRYTLRTKPDDVYLMTPEFLLGSGGKSHRQQASERTEARNRLLESLSKTGKKVILLLDEIHEKTSLFNSASLPYLFEFANYIQRIFVASATFNYESIEVINAVSLVTGQKITVFQAERQKNPPSRLASLYIHICRDGYSKEDMSSLEVGLATELANCPGSVNIITTTKALTKSLVKTRHTGLRKQIESLDFIELTADSPNQFQPARNHIGTTFSTGVNLDDKQGTLFIVLPGTVYGSNSDINYGIFSAGLTSVIQTFARLRNGKAIHVFMPACSTYLLNKSDEHNTLLDTEILDSASRKKADKFDPLFNRLIDKYIDNQKRQEQTLNVLRAAYSGEQLSDIRSHIDHIGFQSRYDYVLSHCSAYLIENSYAYGKQLVPIVLWLALNNQFINCTLKQIIVEQDDTILLPKADKLQSFFEQLLVELPYKNTPLVTVFDELDSMLDYLSKPVSTSDKPPIYSFEIKTERRKGTIEALFENHPAIRAALFRLALQRRKSPPLSAAKAFAYLLDTARESPNASTRLAQPYVQLVATIDTCRAAIRKMSVTPKSASYIKADLADYSSLPAWLGIKACIEEVQNSPLNNPLITTLPLSSKKASLDVDSIIGKLVFDDSFVDKKTRKADSPFDDQAPFWRLRSKHSPTTC